MTEVQVVPEALEASMVLQALGAGKPPPPQSNRRFFHGRESMLELLGRDLETVELGGSVFRIVVGDHGAGKSALVDEHTSLARRKRFVTMRTEISRDCLFSGREGEPRALLQHALLGMRTLGTGDRCALDAFLGSLRDDWELAAAKAGTDADRFRRRRLGTLEDLPKGHDFARIVDGYMRALALGDELYVANARRWLLCQYDRAGDAYHELGVGPILDADFWGPLKLWAKLIRIAERPGLVVVVDEARLLCDLLKPARTNNFAQISRMFNEIVGGEISGLNLILAATPATMTGEFASLCSETGLRSCLQGGRNIGLPTDLLGGLGFRIAELDYDDIVSMLIALRDLIGTARRDARLIPESDVPNFIQLSRDGLGGQKYPLPRQLIYEFLRLHNRVAAEPSLAWSDVLRGALPTETAAAARGEESSEFALGSM